MYNLRLCYQLVNACHAISVNYIVLKKLKEGLNHEQVLLSFWV